MKSFSASVIGHANKERGVTKQDAAMLRNVRGGLLAVVCDGLGSLTQSAWGARQACRAVRSAIEKIDLWFNEREFCELVQQFWLQYIEPISPKDAATTCLVSFVEDCGKAHIAQLGDGLILCQADGLLHRVTPPQSGFAGQTCALSSELRFENWIFFECELTLPGDGTLMMTDGISEDLDQSRLADFYKSLYEDVTCVPQRKINHWIARQLHEWPTLGHSDDKSIAGIYRTQ